MVSYAQPAAANYYTQPSHSTPKSRGHRLCDDCGAVESPSGPRFRLCGGCMTTQYCSPDCQKRHWASHKTICQHTASQLSAAKQQPVGGNYDESVVKHLRKFTSAHQELLNWVVFQALQLKRVPANVRQQALIIELDYNPNAPDSLRCFTIKGTHVVPRTYVTGADANVAADIQRRDDRCRRSGGIGAAVVSIQCGGLSQVMPVEVDPPSQITWDSREDWSEVARHFVNSGRTDFKPISSTSRGIVYG